MNQADELKRLSLGRLPVVTLSCCESLMKTVEIRGKNGRFASPVLFSSVGDKRSLCSGQYSSVANVGSQNQSPFTIREVHVR
ncbi:hypothetical protein T4D_16055 [Trichinella pseudospiralis]|uniref:Uncharacterized protein n=1 Tax=Trichinella pseudospiralis TaxID=6337 RepID=A0A0V1FXJ5_TRIPS|nr:hypothetical protein T4D_16055 [Trichinella pseudospiralis]